MITHGFDKCNSMTVEITVEPTNSYQMRSNLGTFPHSYSFADAISSEVVAGAFYDVDGLKCPRSDRFGVVGELARERRTGLSG